MSAAKKQIDAIQERDLEKEPPGSADGAKEDNELLTDQRDLERHVSFISHKYAQNTFSKTYLKDYMEQ